MLERDEVHVWRASLDRVDHYAQTFEEILSPDERVRAGHFHAAAGRERFVAARGRLRLILGGYLGISPDRLRFRYTPDGKPELEREFGGEIKFNLSHADGIVLYAVARGRELGVDLERVRPDPMNEKVARAYFSAREYAILRELPPAERHKTFFRYWTRKEAYAKARGKGLFASLGQLDAPLSLDGAMFLLNTGDPPHANRWFLHDLDPGPPFVGALVVEGSGWRLRYARWAPSEALT